MPLETSSATRVLTVRWYCEHPTIRCFLLPAESTPDIHGHQHSPITKYITSCVMVTALEPIYVRLSIQSWRSALYIYIFRVMQGLVPQQNNSTMITPLDLSCLVRRVLLALPQLWHSQVRISDKRL